MSTKALDPAALAADAARKAAAAPVRTPQASNYKDLAGPFEVAGGAADAFITESPSGLSYLESRPRNGGRVKRVPLATVGAVFPQVLPAEEESKK
jgi:hypothetical protein